VLELEPPLLGCVVIEPELLELPELVELPDPLLVALLELLESLEPPELAPDAPLVDDEEEDDELPLVTALAVVADE
jgi:hypothetical protein